MTRSRDRLSLLLTAVRVLLAGVLLVLVLRGPVWGALSRALTETPWFPLLFTIPSLLGVFVEAERLRLLLHCQGISVPRARLARLVTAAAFFGACIPGGTGGDVLKFFYLPWEGQRPRSTVLATLLADRAVGLASILLTAFGAAVVALVVGPTFEAAPWILLVPPLGLVAMVAAIGLLWSRSSRLVGLREAVVNRLPFRSSVEAFLEALTLLRDHPIALIRATAWSTLGTITLATAFVLTGQALVPGLDGWVVASIALLGMVANAVPITPGGLGVGEAAFSGLFRLVGASGGASLIVLWRIGTLPVIVTGGIIFALGGARTGSPTQGPGAAQPSTEDPAR